MNDDDRKKARDAGLTVAGIAAGVKLGPAGSAAVALYGKVLLPLIDHVKHRRDRRAEQFMDDFMNSGHPNETAVPLLQAELEQAPAETKDAVFDTLRALDEVLSDDVVPALALLARDYVKEGKPKDRFFMGTLRLLRDMNGAEFKALQSLVAIRSGLWPEPNTTYCTAAKISGKDGGVLWVAPHFETEWDREYDSIFFALVSVGFANVATGVSFHPYQQQAWLLSLEEWQGLAAIMPPRK